jgi:hypothetical protein
MAIELLSAREVATKTKAGLYGDGGGLYLKVSPSGTKSWVFRYWSGGRRHALGLGPYHTVTPAEAREKAREQRRLRLDGHDPVAVKRAKVAERHIETARPLRSGWPSLRPRAGCAVGSRASSIGQRCANIGKVITRRAGGDSSISSCRTYRR